MKSIGIKNYASGVVLCLIIALGAWELVKLVPALEIVGASVIAIITGMVFTIFIKDKTNLQAGITFTSKKVLQYAVILLGFGLNLMTIGKVGLTSLPVILSTIAISLIVAYLFYKLVAIPEKIAILIGVGSSICGGSAIAATAPVIDANDKEIAQSISVIFLFNVIAAVIFPTLGSFLGLSNQGFGLFAGTAINDTSSVTAAAATWDAMHHTGSQVLEYATIVKLTRTLAIIPITLVLSLSRAKKNQVEKKAIKLKNLVPTFILYFVLASIITTIISLFANNQVLLYANTVFSFLKQLSKFFIVMAMAAIGLNTDVIELIKKGGKPILLGFTCWLSITVVSLIVQSLFGILR
ncbi:putative integral membrane protein (TIGR00698 family) [Enterococcus sp. PF1-24]|uniref:YeiH family protein n=1 Tax=unclassified Enterococcus TaxID=2608891 RepID=UPI002475053D|nr:MULTISPECIES: YeiH family protein [unclassified Enterococcus]MDH6365693.1 putative integral membrane protein (TIGR00698 family) [Enterococcus sp. PFB1-1]MDH6402807.1 putative integral membrane protein (TIGR00698 family) [Enterococcus sp. PF1-24]